MTLLSFLASSAAGDSAACLQEGEMLYIPQKWWHQASPGAYLAALWHLPC